MTEDDDFHRRLKEAYKEEASDILTEVQRKLFSLNSSTTYGEQLPQLAAILNLLHSFKGAARAVSESQAVTICQWLESAISGHKQSKEIIPDADLHKLRLSLELLDELVETNDKDHRGKEKIRADVKIILAPLLNDSDNESTEFTANTYDIFGHVDPEPLPTATKTEAAEQPAEISLSTTQTLLVARSPSTPVVIDNLTSVRVPFEKLDRLLTESEELITVKTRSSEHLVELNELKNLLSELVDEISMLSQPDERQSLLSRSRQLQSKIVSVTRHAARDGDANAMTLSRYLESAKTLVMLPVASCFEVFPRLIRELNRELDKEVELEIQGGELEIDRRILERLKDPLTHLLRNAMDHAMESEAERRKAGKQAAKLVVSARQLNGETIEITIVDNGRGIDEEAVRRSAVKKQLVNQAEAEKLASDEVFALIFRPDFSTREKVSELSGRGLGLAIVKEKIEELNGRIELSSKRGSGTTFRIIVPTTLATFLGVLVEASGQFFVVPLAGLNRALRVHPLALEVIDERETFIVDGQFLPVASLSKALGLKGQKTRSSSAGARSGFKYLEMMVISHRDKKAGLIVDQILSEQEFLVKKLGYPLGQLNNFAGATILADGKVALVLNISDLVETIVKTRFMPDQKLPSGLAAMLDREDENNSKPLILVVDDSVTSRVFLRNIVESAGYRVMLAVDGQDALNKLKVQKFDLLLTDVEMPVMDGIALVKNLRLSASDDLKHLPVVLITSLAGKEKQEEGLAAGANAYFVKGDKEQTAMLDVIKKLI